MPAGGSWNVPAGNQARALAAAFPSYAVSVTEWPSVSSWPEAKPRFELVSQDGTQPYCLVSDDVNEIWRVLKGRPCRARPLGSEAPMTLTSLPQAGGPSPGTGSAARGARQRPPGIVVRPAWTDARGCRIERPCRA